MDSANRAGQHSSEAKASQNGFGLPIGPSEVPPKRPQPDLSFPTKIMLEAYWPWCYPLVINHGWLENPL